MNSDARPQFDGPIPETQPTMAPGGMPSDSREGYGANKVAAEHVFIDSGLPVTIIRPSKAHGPGAPRESHFVKRVLDRRRSELVGSSIEGVSSLDPRVGLALCRSQPSRSEAFPGRPR